MRFHVPGEVMRWLAPVIITNVFVWIVTWTPEANYVLCTKTDNCLISWVSALSGWAAASAAALTIYTLYDQIDQQKRQTDFLLGEAIPTMDAIEHMRERHILVVRIVNWNRRAMIVENIWPKADDAIVNAQSVNVNGVAVNMVEQIARGLLVPKFHIPGWEDRATRPPYAEIRLERWGGDDLSTMESWEGVDEILASIQVLGAKHGRLQLKASTGLVDGDAAI